MQLVNFIGSRLLQHDTARVCAPPGIVVRNGNRNIIIATSTRSGTHLAIDLILNSIPAYRRNPLYVNLDTLNPLGSPEQPQLHNAGYIIKTHYPSNRHRHASESLAKLARESVVITVRRPTADIRKSLERWVAAEPHLVTVRRHLDRLDEEIAEFEAFWKDFSPYVIEFKDLFDADRSREIVADIARMTGAVPRSRGVSALPVSRPALVYMNKALTRLLGSHAPRIDTTIRAMR